MKNCFSGSGITNSNIVDDLMLEWKGQGRYDAPAAKLAPPQQACNYTKQGLRGPVGTGESGPLSMSRAVRETLASAVRVRFLVAHCPRRPRGCLIKRGSPFSMDKRMPGKKSVVLNVFADHAIIQTAVWLHRI